MTNETTKTDLKEQNRKLCTFDLAIDETGQDIAQRLPPTEFRIFRAGINTSETNGDVLFDEQSAQMVMQFCAKHNGANPIALDYAHGTTKEKATVKDGIAAGRFNLELRLDSTNQNELWAVNVEYTEAAYAQVMAKEWLFISPTFYTDADSRVMGIICVALTNIPALDNLQPLMAYEANMGETETPTELIEANPAVSELAIVKDNQIKSLSMQVAEFETALSAKDAAINEYAAKVNQYEQTIAKHEATIAEYELASLDVKIKLAIEAGEKQCKVVPAMRSTLIELGKSNLDLLNRHIESLPRIKALAATAIEQKQSMPEMTWASMSDIEKHNLYKTNRELYNNLKAQAK